MKVFLLRYVTLPLVLWTLIVFLGGFLVARAVTQPTIIKAKVLRESGYDYINPVLLCNIDNNQKYNENTALAQKISQYIAKQPQNDISVYYLSLSGGGWSSVNGDEAYSPASMLKVPSVVTTLKYAEKIPSIMSTPVYYDGSFDNNAAEYFKPSKSIKPHVSYSVDDLLTYTIMYSDNNALQLLHETINEDSFAYLYHDLGIDIPPNTLDFMSAKTYSLFLRVLYNSTYLTRESSEKVLKLMVDSDFPIGLRAGVPKGIAVAEKFGEREIYSPSHVLQSRELHDCGIIYATGKPYILCIMTRGQDFQSLATAIQGISNLVYTEVAK